MSTRKWGLERKVRLGVFMKVLDEIIELAVSEGGSVTTLLRKCLVLAHTLKNDRLKVWAENELNGYDPNDAGLPEYRKTVASAKGSFLGPGGAQLQNQPLPPGMLDEQHRHLANSAVLFQSTACYEGVDGKARFIIEWPADVILMYQQTFLEGGFALHRAWLEVPGTVLVGLTDTIRTSVLSSK
ncbi:MAG: hypothetical protein ACLQOO_09115 [Terriglobia bacterium]